MQRWIWACLIPAVALAGGDTLVQQGRLMDGAGTPLEGSHSVTFTIYASGVDVWNETDAVQFSGGYYATVLGDGPTPLSNLDFANTEYALGIAIDGGDDLEPTTPFSSVVSALTGPINVSDEGIETPCNLPAQAGTIRYHSGSLQVCDGSGWAEVGTGGSSGDCTPGSQTFTYTGSGQAFAMPAGCTTLTVKAWGAGGAGGYISSSRTHHGGAGGYTGAVVDTTPGTAYIVVVGDGGVRNTGFGNSNVAYGFAGAPYGNNTPCAVGGAAACPGSSSAPWGAATRSLWRVAAAVPAGTLLAVPATTPSTAVVRPA